MKRTLSNLITLLLALGGVFVAGYLSYHHYHPDVSLGCSAGSSSCEGVLKSQYSSIGPIPTALVGLGMYLVLLIGAVLRHKSIGALRATPETLTSGEAEDGEASAASENPAYAAALAHNRRFDMGIWALSSAGALISWFLQYNALFVVEAFCKWCFSSAVIVTLIALVSTKDCWLEGRKLEGDQKLVIAVLSFIGVTMLAVYSPKVHDQWLVVDQNNKRGKRSGQVQGVDRSKLITKDVHIRGNKNAPLLLLEFADLQCQACKQADMALRQLERRFSKDACFAYRNYPLSKHPFALSAAYAVEAAAEQGKFWEMKERIYDRQEQMDAVDFDPNTFVKWAKELGMDTTLFARDYTLKSVRDRVKVDQEEGLALDMQTTPTFFVITADGIWRFEGMGALVPALQDTSHPIHQSKAPALPAELRKN